MGSPKLWALVAHNHQANIGYRLRPESNFFIKKVQVVISNKIGIHTFWEIKRTAMSSLAVNFRKASSILALVVSGQEKIVSRREPRFRGAATERI
jgi:hypothetical protein